MISSKGNKIANQFVIGDVIITVKNEAGDAEIKGDMFQSYNSNIAFNCGRCIYLDVNKWDYSVITGKYRNQFLNETKKETQAKIDSGEYILTDLNGYTYFKK